MTRFGNLAIACSFVVGAAWFAGCDKPSEDDCRKAIANMRAIHGTENPTLSADQDVRRCKGASSKKSVQCAIEAKTKDDLDKCGKGFAGHGSAGGSAGSAGSAAPGPAGATGTAGSGGSAAAPASGSGAPATP